MIVPKYFSFILMESSLIIKVLNRMIRIECVMSSYLSTSHVVPMMACETSLSDLFWNLVYTTNFTCVRNRYRWQKKCRSIRVNALWLP